MKRPSVYAQVMVEMYLKGMDSLTLSRKTGMSYPTLRRKLRGDGAIRLEEAMRIRSALECDLPLEKLFERRTEM